MRVTTAVLALLLPAGVALAADTDGVIQKIDTERMTITLDDGQIYRLPGEMDVSALAKGMDVVIAFQELDNGVKQITDMVLPE